MLSNTAEKYIDLSNALLSLANDISSIVDDSLRSTFDSAEEDLDIIFFYCVDSFYNEYSPSSYSRTDALYEGYKFYRGNNGLSLDWETSPSLIPDSHRASPGYIYHLTYELGYHGGHADGGGDSYSMLSIPAMIGKPIDERIQEKFEEYRNDKKLQLHFDNYLDSNFSAALQKYGLQGLF